MRMVRRAFGRAFGEDELEDIYGSAWLGTLRALERRHGSLSDEEIRKYVFTAVARQASKELRRRGRRPTTPLDAIGETADLGPAPDERAAAAEERQLARDLLASLPARRRAVMLLRYGAGLEPSQVCALVKGLSARAYRKEVTRGVDELTEKLRLVEQGDWCREREPMLKAYAAGLADDDERRQVRHHLSRCRDCSELVGRLSGHLHDLGGALVTPAALEGVRAGGGMHDRIVGLIDHVRASLPGAGGQGDVADDAVSVAASGATRGGGAAGAGLLTKLAGLGAGGKLAAICLAGGAVATTCAATGVLPALPLSGGGSGAKTIATTIAASHRASAEASSREAPRGGSALQAIQAEEAAPAPSAPTERRTVAPAGEATATVAPASTSATPLAPRTPPVQQQFGVPAATPPSPPSSGAAGADATGGGGSPTQQEFGP